MKIYTKKGDDGTTHLFGGKEIIKNDVRLESYGTIDELNSLIGLVISEGPSKETIEILILIQNELFMIGGELATPPDVESNLNIPICKEDIKRLEKFIDGCEDKLNPLKNFILPGGSKIAATLHFARTVCRRAERRIIELNLIEKVNPEIIVYINRLSDLLFVLARYENHVSSTPEIEWKQRG